MFNFLYKYIINQIYACYIELPRSKLPTQSSYVYLYTHCASPAFSLLTILVLTSLTLSKSAVAFYYTLLICSFLLSSCFAQSSANLLLKVAHSFSNLALMSSTLAYFLFVLLFLKASILLSLFSLALSNFFSNSSFVNLSVLVSKVSLLFSSFS